mgnify:CR=1 FL=1
MAYQNDDLLAFRQLRAQAARKKQLETQRAALTDRCQVLSVQAEACRKARQAAEQEVATLESKGPMGLLYTIAGDKAKRLDEARQTLRKARADDQQASWDLAQAQVDLAQTERSLEPLAGCDSAFAAARQARATTLQAADLPQSRQLRILEEALAQGEDWFQRLTDLCAQCRAVLDAARQTLRLAERVEQFRTPSTLALLQERGRSDRAAAAEIGPKSHRPPDGDGGETDPTGADTGRPAGPGFVPLPCGRSVS